MTNDVMNLPREAIMQGQKNVVRAHAQTPPRTREADRRPFIAEEALVTIHPCAVRICTPKCRHQQFLRLPVFIPMKRDLPREHWPIFTASLETATLRYGDIGGGGWGWWPSSVDHTLVGVPSELVARIYLIAWLARLPQLLRAYRDPIIYSVTFDPAWYASEYSERQSYLRAIRHQQHRLCLLT